MEQRFKLGPANDTSAALDTLRAAASQAVCVGHALSMFGLYPQSMPHVQSLAVGVFFLLSGFLICRMLSERTKAPDYTLGAFVIGRFARIYSGWIPALIFVALADAIVPRLITSDATLYTGWHNFFGNLLMLQNYAAPWPVSMIAGHLRVPDYGSAGPFWTLAIEWHIYMLVGAAFFLALGRQQRAAKTMVVIFLWLPMRYLFGDVQPGLGTGLFSVWLIGGALALFSWRLSWIASIAAIAAGTVVLGRIASGAEYSLLAYAGLLLILVSLLMLPPTISASSSAGQAVTIIAGYSFTLYLTHYTILYHLHSIWPDGGWHLALTGIALSNVVALAMAWPTEMRHRALARWLMKFDPFAKPKRLWQAPGPTG